MFGELYERVLAGEDAGAVLEELTADDEVRRRVVESLRLTAAWRAARERRLKGLH
ncbi:MAG: hypothetical protein KF683_00875 [Rubrivivax sp.]|nr:hypothetical protein [Rubrivivax sp.]